MKKLLIISLACACMLPLSACVTDKVPSTAPVTYANKTAADEQLAVGAELAYKSWRLAVETGVQSGLIKGQVAGKVAALDKQLYSALSVVESAYETGNSASIVAAAANFNGVLATSYATINGAH